MFRHLKVEERGAVAIVRIDRPPANAMDLELLDEGHRVLDELAASDPGAVVITGRDGVFSAGLDLKVAPTLDREGQRAMVEGINRIFPAWYGFPRPVVCAVNGHAIAGGMILALCGDYRVGSTEGKLGLTELRVGLGFPTGAIGVVQAELTPAVARVLVLRAHLVEPPEALELGVVDELAEPPAVLDRAVEVAEELGELPADAYAYGKRQLRGRALDAIARATAEDPLLERWAGEETAGASAATLERER